MIIEIKEPEVPEDKWALKKLLSLGAFGDAKYKLIAIGDSKEELENYCKERNFEFESYYNYSISNELETRRLNKEHVDKIFKKE